MGQNVILYVSNAYHTVYNALRKSLIQLVCDLTEEGQTLKYVGKKALADKNEYLSTFWPCMSQNCLLAYGSTTA